MHHLQRGAFLGDEQHLAPERQIVRDHVGDGLRLAGARRPVEHEVAAARRADHRGELRRVGGKRREQLGRRHLRVERVGPRRLHIARIGLARGLQQVTYDRVRLQRLGAVDQVLPHQIFGERKGAQHHIGYHLEAGHVAHRTAHDRPHPRHVDPRGVLRQLAGQLGNLQLEVLPQHLEEREVEARLVLVDRELHPRAHAAALELHRQQDQWRAILARIAVRLFPQ